MKMMKPTAESIVERGVREQPFSLECEGRVVPAILWTPEAGGSGQPLVLLGHGGSLHKRADYILACARRLARDHGIASVAIDAPGHGERADLDTERVGRLDRVWGRAGVVEETIADWRAALDAVQDMLGAGPVGYFGMSMGTMMGVPLIAAESRIQAAVFGLMGTWSVISQRLADDAARVTCPVRFLVQWDDEIVPRDLAFDLFDRLGSKQKSMRTHPGGHLEIPPDEMRAVPEFLASHLGG